MIKTHILNANGTFDSLEEIIKKTINETLKKVTAVMSIDNVDIVVTDNPWLIIKNYGLGGSTHTSHFIEISIDPKFPNSTNQIKKEVPHTIAHELHHAMRMQSICWRKTLLDAVVQEGLADHFSIEVLGGKPKQWSIAVQGKKLQEILQKAEKEFNSKTYDYYNWFFSNNKTDMPHWAGYSIGFYLVGNYLKNHPDKKPSTLYAAKATNFSS